METQYHKFYSKEKIERPVVLLIRAAIKAGFFKEKEFNKKLEILNSLHKALCEFYKLDVIKVNVIENYLGTGKYNWILKEIFIDKISLVTYLHEFYHYKAMSLNQKENTEDNARGWSISLFYLATPNLCRTAIENNKIMHQTKFIEEVKENG